MRGHEVDRIGRRHLRRDDEVALVLAVLVVDQDEHPAVARFVDDLLDPDEHGRLVILGEETFELAEGVGGGVPALLVAFAQGVGVEPGSAGKSGAGHLSFGDNFADSFNDLCAHGGRLYHIIM